MASSYTVYTHCPSSDCICTCVCVLHMGIAGCRFHSVSTVVLELGQLAN